MEHNPYHAYTGKKRDIKEESMPNDDHLDDCQLFPDRFPPRKKGKHLEGWQWRESKRSVERKEKAKAKHFGLTDAAERLPDDSGFVIERELGGEYAIVSEVANRVVKLFYQGELIECALRKGLSFNLVRTLAVGDEVTIAYDDNKPIIEHMAKRETVLSRIRRDSSRRGVASEKNEQVIAANIDIAVIVVATKNPPLHPRFIDRYLILVEHSGIMPIVCLNKCDLGGDVSILNAYRELGIKVVETSAIQERGIGKLRDLIRGKTVVLVGQSGVGKSSLINTITPMVNLRTGETSKKTGRGKHTTASSSLCIWDSNSYIIDTPGIRALEIWSISKEDLQLYFDEIQEKSGDCKYSNCLHYHEKIEDCAVKRAVKDSLISSTRYDSYLRVLSEL